MKLSGARIEAFLKRPDTAAKAILVYGPDSGLVRERAEALARTVVADLGDAFRVAVLSGRGLAADPALLADEAAAIAFGGGRRVVRVRDAGEEAAAVLAGFLDDSVGDALVVVEAGELGPRSKLRLCFEASKAGAAIPCYADDPGSLGDLVEAGLRKDGVTIAPDALQCVVDHLGGDRMVTRNEIEKLSLYAGRGGRIELADALDCIGDSAALSLDEIALAVAQGDVAAVLRGIDRSFSEGNSAVSVIRAVGRHFIRLHLAAGLVASGQRPEQAIGALRPPVFFKAKDAFVGQLRRWPVSRLGRAIERLTEAEVACKSTGAPDEALCTRVLLEIARAAGRRAAA